MVMQDPHNVRQQITPRMDEVLRIISWQFNILDVLRPRLQDCGQPSPAQLASHRADAQGDARLLRGIIAILTDSIPQLDVAADLLTSSLKHALDSGAARDALPLLAHGQSQDQTAQHLLALPRTRQVGFDLHRFHVSIHISLSLLRLAIDYYLHRCIYILRRLGLPDRHNWQVQPVDHAMVEPRAYLERAFALIEAAMGHSMDAVYGHI